VFNQPPPLVGYDAFAQDAALAEGVRREGAAWATDWLGEIGRRAGSAEAIQQGFDANAHPPTLKTYDRYGRRIDEVEFHPAWHALMATATGWGLHANPWRDPQSGAHVARIAGFYLWSQVEAGHGCPISMTHAAVPALRAQPEIAAEWEARLTARSYEPTLQSTGGDAKPSALCGMGMTEKQGGSDVRANTTRADPVGAGGPGGEYLLTGHKWFCSAPMSDAFLMLAQAPGGLSCFFVPRILPDGSRNRLYLQRLKDKLGNRSNASSEIEIDHAWARMIGEEGRGVRTIVEMVNYTRLDCMAGSAALMRQAVAQATHHAAHRAAFGRALIDQPLMQNVLADLAIESEAATALTLRVARACDNAASDPAEAQLKRLGTAIGKYWVCKRTPPLVAEALECLGGNGYVEESGMPRLYREAPLNSIWEGSGNVNCLDTLRALSREPATLAAYFDEVALARGANATLDAATDALAGEARALRDPAGQATLEWRARRLVERLALVLQGSLLVRHSSAAVADAFCASRLGDAGGLTFGDLPVGVDAAAILTRARPQV
jgi:putative acyl-CoA dehydrogenase